MARHGHKGSVLSGININYRLDHPRVGQQVQERYTLGAGAPQGSSVAAGAAAFNKSRPPLDSRADEIAELPGKRDVAIDIREFRYPCGPAGARFSVEELS